MVRELTLTTLTVTLTLTLTRTRTRTRTRYRTRTLTLSLTLTLTLRYGRRTGRITARRAALCAGTLPGAMRTGCTCRRSPYASVAGL